MGSRSSTQHTIILATLTLLLAAISLFFIRNDSTPTAAVVPPEFAAARGASDWDTEQHKRFLDDNENQWPMTQRQKAARGDRSPLDWLPAFDQCRYISRFVDVTQRYRLELPPAEMRQLVSQRQRCYTRFL